MPILTQPAFGPKLSIGFVTGGAVLDVWCLVWRFTIAGSELTPMQKFWFYGLLLTGATFIGIGLLLGNIGRAARKAELPPTAETVHAEAAVQAAGTMPVAIPGAAQPAVVSVPTPMTSAAPAPARFS